jgi:hypothetical protein
VAATVLILSQPSTLRDRLHAWCGVVGELFHRRSKPDLAERGYGRGSRSASLSRERAGGIVRTAQYASRELIVQHYDCGSGMYAGCADIPIHPVLTNGYGVRSGFDRVFLASSA